MATQLKETTMSMPTGPGGVPLLEARGLTVRFGKVTALNGLDLTAPPGQVLAILGPNGAGKTTFVRTVATLVRPTSGEASWCTGGTSSANRRESAVTSGWPASSRLSSRR